MEIAKAIVENFAGNGASAQEIAFSIADSPFISGWRTLCGASVAYGTTKGGCNAKQIFFTELGKRIIGGDECAAKQEAILHLISVDQEAASIPVPDKVFDDMRQCAAAVIHVSSEGEWKDPEGHLLKIGSPPHCKSKREDTKSINQDWGARRPEVVIGMASQKLMVLLIRY